MKGILLFIISFVLFSTACRQKSEFFDDCNCSKVKLKDAITVTDTLNHFQIEFPDRSWYHILSLDTNGNSITGGDTSLGYLRIVVVTELNDKSFLKNWDIQQAGVESEFNVVEKGEIELYNQIVHWNLVRIDVDQRITWSLYLTVEHPREDRYYLLNLSVDDDKNARERICTLESFLETFEMIE
ncbi:MAG: hypothetical protein IIA45_08930 [Bacteroidetes bacterium]|nr:hypothetical protein [Bacteroidota bacterium]